MTKTATSPRLPNLGGDTVYLVLDGFGTFGQADRKSDPRHADRQTVLAKLLSGQYEGPLRSVALNTAERWARNVTAEIAQEVLALAGQDLSPAVQDPVRLRRREGSGSGFGFFILSQSGDRTEPRPMCGTRLDED
jgi:hypothetical protein